MNAALRFLMYRSNGVLVRLGEALGWEWLIYNPIVRYGFELGARKDGPIVIACEYSKKNRDRTARLGVRCEPFDVGVSTATLPGGPFDVAISIEVAEHIPPALAGRFVEFMSNQSDLLVLSAAQPGQGGAGHVNEQPKAYWIEKFAARGYRLDEAATSSFVRRLKERDAAWFLLNNAMILRRDAGHGGR